MATTTAAQKRDATADNVSSLQSKQTLLRIRQAITYALLILGSIAILIPVFWMVSSALKPNSQIFLFPPEWIPNPIQWDNFWKALTSLPFEVYFKNTMIIEIGTIVGTVLSCTVVAY